MDEKNLIRLHTSIDDLTDVIISLKIVSYMLEEYGQAFTMYIRLKSLFKDRKPEPSDLIRV